MARQRLIDLSAPARRPGISIDEAAVGIAGFLESAGVDPTDADGMNRVAKAISKKAKSAAMSGAPDDSLEDEIEDDPATCQSCGGPVDSSGDYIPADDSDDDSDDDDDAGSPDNDALPDLGEAVRNLSQSKHTRIRERRPNLVKIW